MSGRRPPHHSVAGAIPVPDLDGFSNSGPHSPHGIGPPGPSLMDPPQPKKPSACSKFCSFIKSVVSFLVSHIGLLSLVVGYSLMGAAIFEELERYNEIQVKRNMTQTREGLTEKLWEITMDMDVLTEKKWTDEVINELRQFEKSMIIAMKEKGWDGSEDEEQRNWTFAGSLFYSITVITTIGYGHIAPKTAAAKIVTIFYAIMGIPLTVLCWSNIGDAMANAFRFCYWRIFCYVCTRKPKRRRRRHISRQHMPPNRAMSMRQRSRSHSASLRRSQRTSQRSTDTNRTESSFSYSLAEQERPMVEDYQNKSTKNGGVSAQLNDSDLDLITTPTQNELNAQQHQPSTKPQQQPETSSHQPQTNNSKASPVIPEKKQSVSARMARGLGFAKRSDRESQKSSKSTNSDSLILNPAASNSSPSPQPPPSTLRQFSQGSQQPMRLDRVPEDASWEQHQRHLEERAAAYYYADYQSEDEHDDFSTKSVPIWLSLCLVIAYIVWGAFIFQEWESWSLLDAAYFCFITLTTIGFGDLVPNAQSKDGKGEERLALCSLYLLFGIAMIAMSFNLVQEQVINSVKTLGRQLGILKDEDEEEDY